MGASLPYRRSPAVLDCMGSYAGASAMPEGGGTRQALISTVQVGSRQARMPGSRRDTCGQHAAEYISSRFQ